MAQKPASHSQNNGEVPAAYNNQTILINILIKA
jgi:hypothetical protein